MSAGLGPPPGFATAPLLYSTIAIGELYHRVWDGSFPDPLGFGKGASRFSDPRQLPEKDRFGVLYLGSTVEVCFLETLLRDQRNGIHGVLPVSTARLRRMVHARIGMAWPLRVVDLTAGGGLAMGIPTDVCGAADHPLAQAWFLAIHEHADRPDGILYPSRLNGERNLAVFSRAVGGLVAGPRSNLLEQPELPLVLARYRVALLGP